MRDVTFRPLSLPACLVCTLDASSSVQSFPEPATTISHKFSEHMSLSCCICGSGSAWESWWVAAEGEHCEGD
jgi:hypothetical protein